MKRGFAALAVIGIVAAVAVFAFNSAPFTKMSLRYNSDSAFIEYLAKYGKSYEELSEYEMRKKIFEERNAIINEHNTRNNETWSMGLNEFSDMLTEEISKTMGRLNDIELTKHLEVSPAEL
jgi:hypothetical protein